MAIVFAIAFVCVSFFCFLYYCDFLFYYDLLGGC